MGHHQRGQDRQGLRDGPQDVEPRGSHDRRRRRARPRQGQGLRRRVRHQQVLRTSRGHGVRQGRWYVHKEPRLRFCKILGPKFCLLC